MAAAEQPGPAADERELLRERMAGLGAIAAGVAHELNNPIGYIASNLNTLGRYGTALVSLVAHADAAIPESGRAAWDEAKAAARWDYLRGDLPALIDETRAGARHLTVVVNELKALARSTRDPEQVAPDACVRAALTVLAHQLKHRIVVQQELAADAPLALVRAQVVQVFINLVHNAVQSLGERGGTLRITSIQDADGATVSVEDDGPGVPVERRAGIFAPFVTTKTGGSGLGLAIAARIARSHGGDIACDASPALGGARFSVRLAGWCGQAGAQP